MGNLTTKELTFLGDLMTEEQTLVKKYKLYATLCSDPQLQTKCQQEAAKHQNHYNTLVNELN
ncbi:MAG: spore coat protein [Angelakisella sp.]